MMKSATARTNTQVTDAPPKLEEIYSEHFDHVWHTLRRLGIRHADLSDKVHDVFLVVHRRLCDFDTSRTVRPWLTGIAYRVAADERRLAKNRREVISDKVDLERHATESPEALTARSEARELISAGLERLPIDQRVVVIMSDIDGLGGPEIADALGVPQNTVYSRLRLGRKKFASAIRALSRREEVV